MLSLSDLIVNAKKEGFDEANAEAKVCQDVILYLICQSRFKEHITVKGGVVMRNLSGSVRRATQDMDLDFLRYSLADDSIMRFIRQLNDVGAVTLRTVGSIEELKQQDYHGKPVNLTMTDHENTTLKTKIDLGVHKHVDILQEEYCFDVGMSEECVCLLINSKEQMLTEKLRSILKFGAFSTRYKDVYDICYLSRLVNRETLQSCFSQLIYEDDGMREKNIDDILRRIETTFRNKEYVAHIKTSRKNWLGIELSEVFDTILAFLRELA